MRVPLSLALLALGGVAQAHDGHGAFGSHLHPGEALGLLALAVVAGLLVLRWWRR